MDGDVTCDDVSNQIWWQYVFLGNFHWSNLLLFFDLHLHFINYLSQTKFVVDEVSVIIKEVIENTIGGNAYQQNKVGQWTSSVVESCLGSLAKLQKPYKYIGELEAIWYVESNGFKLKHLLNLLKLLKKLHTTGVQYKFTQKLRKWSSN